MGDNNIDQTGKTDEGTVSEQQVVPEVAKNADLPESTQSVVVESSQDQSSPPLSGPKSKRKMILAILALVFVGLLVAIAVYVSRLKDAGEIDQKLEVQTVTPVSIQLSWFHTAEFAGFYIAKEKGYYRDVGLEVTYFEAEPPTPPADQVAAGKADFGVAGIDGILLSREKGNNMTAVAAIYQQSPVAFIVLKDSGINNPEDFIGKRVTIECGSNAEYPQRAVLNKLGITKDKITEVCSSYSIDDLLNDETDVFAGFVTNEPILLELLGHEVRSILVTDYDVNFYANMIFTTENMLKNNPEIVRKFVQATIKGYEYALANPDEAVQATLSLESGLGELSAEHQRRTMNVQTPLIFTGRTPIGWMEDEIWAQGRQILLDLDVIKEPADITGAYTNEFVSR